MLPDSNTRPWYLTDVSMALMLDEATGNVFLNTGIQGNVYITGPVSIPGNVVTVQGTSPWVVTGNVNAAVTGSVAVVGNIAGITALPAITGNVSVVSGNSNVVVTAMPSITGTVAVNSLPSITGNVNAVITAMPSITGNVGILGNANVVIQGTPNVNANVSGNVGVTGNVAVTQATTPWVVSGNVSVQGTSEVSIVGTNIDAFGRLRVSNPYTLFDSSLNGERRYDFSTATTNTGAVTFDYNANVRVLAVDSATNSSVIRESLYVFPYQPGKSLLVMNSFKMADNNFNLTQRVGFFGSANGVYFQQVGKIASFVIRSSSSGAMTEQVVTQTNWNGDPLDGTGASGITLDLNATQLAWQDIEWLGVGSVRCGFVMNGEFIVCHTFNHANNPLYATTYMGSAVLPVRFELTSTSAGVGIANMLQICSTVISEGGYNQPAATFTAGTGTTTVRLANQNTYYPIASIKLQPGYLNSIVKFTQVDILSPTVNYYRWVVLKNATLTGATWASSSSTTRVAVDTAATTVSGGTEFQSGFASSRENLVIPEANFYAQLGRTLANVSDTFTLALAATNNNADVCAQIGWQEIV